MGESLSTLFLTRSKRNSSLTDPRLLPLRIMILVRVLDMRTATSAYWLHTAWSNVTGNVSSVPPVQGLLRTRSTYSRAVRACSAKAAKPKKQKQLYFFKTKWGKVNEVTIVRNIKLVLGSARTSLHYCLQIASNDMMVIMMYHVHTIGYN